MPNRIKIAKKSKRTVIPGVIKSRYYISFFFSKNRFLFSPFQTIRFQTAALSDFKKIFPHSILYNFTIRQNSNSQNGVMIL